MAFVTTNDGIKLFYRVDGPEKAPALVMSNSLGTTHDMWHPQAPVLEKQFRLIRYDTRGHGQSAVPTAGYDMERLGRDVVAVLDDAGVKRAHFCGLSMGGSTGMWLGRYAPERFDRLVLCNTGAKIGTAEVWNPRIQAVREKGMEAILSGVIERWFTPGFRERAPKEVERIAAQTRGTAPEGYARACEAIRDMDLRDQIGAIANKTMIIAGAHDPATPPADGKSAHEKIMGSRYVELPAAHISNVEAADAFTKALLDFLTA